MATTTTTTAATTAPVGAEVATTEEAALVLTGDLANLKEAFDKAHADFDHAEGARAAAAHAKSVAAVWMSRIAYRTMTHPDVATKRYPENITGAAKVLGMPVGTLRPYGLAGIALNKKDMAGLLSAPEAEDIALVEGSFDATTRADQKAKRIKEAEKKAALEAKARELDALKATNGTTTTAPAPTAPTGADTAPTAPATTGTTTAPATAPTAPATAPATEGPSLAEDTLTTARELVRKLKALKAGGDKAAILKVNAILADFYPALKA